MALLVLPGHEELACGESRLERARRRLQLPIRHKGGGVASVALRHPIAYFSALAASASKDEFLSKHIDGSRVSPRTCTRACCGRWAGVAPHGVSGGSGVQSGPACAAEAATLC